MVTKNSQHNCAFIIPTFTNKSGLENLLQNLSNLYPQIPIVIINNGGKFKSLSDLWVKNINNQVVFINRLENTGFAKACNDGAVKADELFHPKYFVFLNDDTLFTDDWLRRCIAQLEKSKWAATSPVLFNLKGQVENCGYVVLPHGKVKLVTDIKSEEKIDGLSATALVFNAEKFNFLKGFDEKFFAYLEDIDLFLRAKQKGLKFGITKEAKAIHEGQKTSRKFKTKKAWLDFRNWIRLISKNWSREDIRKYWWEIVVERGRNLSGVIKTLF